MSIVVKAKPGDSADQVIRKFKKQVLQTQLLTELREREFYKKPSVKKKEKLSEFKRRSKRRARMKWAREK